MLKLSQTLVVIILLILGNSVAMAIVIESKIANGPWKSKRNIEPLVGQVVFLRVKPIEGADIQWFIIQPDINIRYNNAVWPWLPGAYEWKGFDEIKYNRVPLDTFKGKWQIQIFPKNGEQNTFSTRSDSIVSYLKRRVFDDSKNSSFRVDNIGSFWFQAEVTKDGRTLNTPGIESKDKRGLSPKVFRISVKQGNDLIGNLTSYFNVPAVFGSTPYQVKNHIGIDCADVLMAAYSKSKNQPIAKDYNVAMLTRKFKTIAKTQISNGEPLSEIRWQKDIQSGDFIAVRYSGSKQYQHIGALYQDKNDNGLLDSEDTVIHAGPDPLHFSKIGAGVFDGKVLILRPE